MDLNDFVLTTSPNTVIYLPNFVSHEEEKEILDKVYSAPKPKWTHLRNRRLQNWGGIPHVNGMIPEKIPEVERRLRINKGDVRTGVYVHRSKFNSFVCTFSCNLNYEHLELKGSQRSQDWLNRQFSENAFAQLMEHIEWLQKYMNRIRDLNVFGEKSPNHVLINEYTAGQGIMPHTDGPLFFPIVSTISCGSHTFLQFQSSNEDVCFDESATGDGVKSESRTKRFTLLLEPRSLLILKDDVYKNYLHGIDEVVEDTVSEAVNNLRECQEFYELGQHLRRSTRISLTIRNVPRCCNFKLKF